MGSLTVKSVSGSVSPCDGDMLWAQVGGAGEQNMAFIQAATAGWMVDLTSRMAPIIYTKVGGTATNFSQMNRSIINFNASAASGIQIVSASIALQGFNKGQNLGAPDLHITGHTIPSTATLVVGDWDLVLNTSFGSIVYASFNTAGTNTITLNAAGLAYIQAALAVDGLIRLSARLNWDVEANFTGTWSANKTAFFEFLSADQGASTAPALTLSYLDNTFSFSGANANKIMNSNNTMEYSLDGGASYTTCSTDTDLTSIVTSVVFANGIKIRFIATPATIQTIAINVPPSAPEIVFPRSGADKNKLLGSTSLMEYSLNGGSTYTACTTDILLLAAALVGVSAIWVRVIATGYYPSGNVFEIGLEPVMNKLTTPQMVDPVRTFHPQLFGSRV